MAADEYPLDRTTIVGLRKAILPKPSPNSYLTMADMMINGTVEKFLADSSTLEQFIKNLGHAALNNSDPLLRIIQEAVRDKAQMYLDEVKRNK